MRIIVGQAARKEDFWDREKELTNIWDAIESGSHILLAAPRRVGKTSIMYKIKDEPRDNFIALYTIVESADSANKFWRYLFQYISSTDFANTFSNKARHFFAFVKTITLDSASTNGVKFGESGEIAYFDAFKQLIEKIDDNTKLIIMIDEFAQAIENIIKKGKESEAETLLQDMRTLRQDDRISEKVSFIYAGSIGLESVVTKIDSIKHINDLNSIKINPFDKEEAKMFAKRLANDNDIPLLDEQINYVLEKIEWLIPFYIQIILQELRPLRKELLSNEDIDRAFKGAIEQRHHFEHWEKRLKSLKNDEYKFAKELLNKISTKSTIRSAEMLNLAVKHSLDQDEAKNIIHSLVYDGYINNNDDARVYRFNSAMLKMWWFKNVAN